MYYKTILNAFEQAIHEEINRVLIANRILGDDPYQSTKADKQLAIADRRTRQIKAFRTRLLSCNDRLITALETCFANVSWDSETDSPRWELDGNTVRLLRAAIAGSSTDLLDACRKAIETLDDDAPGLGYSKSELIRILYAAVSKFEEV